MENKGCVDELYGYMARVPSRRNAKVSVYVWAPSASGPAVRKKVDLLAGLLAQQLPDILSPKKKPAKKGKR